MQPLDRQQQHQLLRLARRTLEQFVVDGARLALDLGDPLLLQPAGCFVSLHRQGPEHQLRGCIGTFEARQALVDNVAQMAIAAATRDPRFAPVTSDELPLLSIEISVLSPPQPTTAEQVRVGLHGLQITRGAWRGVLLPQVATAQGWDRETFLASTCRKAGLPAEAWRQPQTTIESFTAQVFSEADAPSS
ncbi:MAG: AmmeMemoRadiSam system protein A [Proteobacteria bacterium]|nr:AmmeMemoRadiSam system protein A [Pseudomonadota bacterium]